MAWLFNSLVNVVRDIIYGALVIVTHWFTSLLNLSDTEFYDTFQFMSENGNSMNLLDILTSYVILPLALALLIFNLVWGLYRSMFSKKTDGEADEPFPLIAWTVVFMFLAFNIKDFLTMFSDMITMVWGYMENGVGAFSNSVAAIDYSTLLNGNLSFSDEALLNDVNFLSGITALLIQNILSIILAVILGWKFITMMFQYVSRYVRYKFVCLLAPLAMSAGGASATREITKKYFRLFVSCILSMLFSAMITYLYCWCMAKTLRWEAEDLAGNILMFAITLAVYDFYVRLDSLLDKLGLTNVSEMAPRFPILPITLANSMSRVGGMIFNKSAGVGPGNGKLLGNKNTGPGAGTGGLTGADGSGKMNGINIKPVPSMDGAEVDKKRAENAAKASEMLGGKSISKDIGDNTDTFKPYLSPDGFTKKGQPVNDANSSMAVMTQNEDGSMNVSNIAKDPDSDGWKDLTTGSKISQEKMDKYGNAAQDKSGWDLQMAKIGESNIDPKNAHRFGESLKNNAIKDKRDGSTTAYGMMKGDDGKNYFAEFSQKKDGSWETSVDGNTYASPQEAAEAIGASSADIYSEMPKQIDSSTISSSGSLNNAFMDHVGIKGGSTRSPMPQNQGFEVLSVGNNEIHGIYANMSGEVKTFSGNRVSENEAMKNRSQCIKINTGHGHSTWMKINDGSSNSAIRKYAGNTTFQGGKFVNKYSGHNHLDNEGNA